MPIKSRRGPKVKAQSREENAPYVRSLKCFDEVYQRVLEGWPLLGLAKYIQEQRKEALNISRGALVAQLARFRKTVPPEELVRRKLPKASLDAFKKLENGLDELSEMQRLYKLQMRRIGIDHEHEKSIKKLFPSMGQEVRIGLEILRAYADLKMDLGLAKRQIGQIEVESRLLADVAVRYNKPEVQKVMSDSQSRQKVLSLVERLLSRPVANLAESSDEEAITVEAEPSESDRAVPEEDLLPDDVFGEDTEGDKKG